MRNVLGTSFLIGGVSMLSRVSNVSMGSSVDKIFGGLVTIEQRRGLFQGPVLRFNNEEVAVDELERRPNAVDNVVSPGDAVERNGVDVLVEDEGE